MQKKKKKKRKKLILDFIGLENQIFASMYFLFMLLLCSNCNFYREQQLTVILLNRTLNRNLFFQMNILCFIMAKKLNEKNKRSNGQMNRFKEKTNKLQFKCKRIFCPYRTIIIYNLSYDLYQLLFFFDLSHLLQY